MASPVIHIVIPVYNGADHLRECLDSILNQTYQSWSALIVNNCSSDLTAEIADEYTKNDSRIACLTCSEFLCQAANYNRGIAYVIDAAEYIKIVEADNILLPNCLELQLSVLLKDPTVGIVGSYWIFNKRVVGKGIDYRTNVLPGSDAWRLLVGLDSFNSGIAAPPTTQLFRSAALRSLDAWFRPEIFYDDIDVLARILLRWNYGYVHQILSFVRSDNSGILSNYMYFDYKPAEQFFLLREHGAHFGDDQWLDKAIRYWTIEYYSCIAMAIIKRRKTEYFAFHVNAFRSARLVLNKRLLTQAVAKNLFRLLLNPMSTTERLVAAIMRRSAPVREE